MFFRFVTPRTVRLTIERQLYRGVSNGALEGGINGSYVVVKEQKTRSARISYLSEHRTLLPSSISFHPTLLSLSLFISIYSLFSIFHVYCHPLSVSWVCVKRSFRCCAAFRQSTSSIYTSGFPLERSSPSYVLLYIRHYTRIELSIYLSIYLYLYIYILLQRYVYIYIDISLCV